MTDGVGCTVLAFHLRGVPLPRERYRVARGDRRTGPRAGRCDDCGVPGGGVHHPGCDLERCPQCRGQAFGCGCRFDEDRFEPSDG